MLTKIYISVFKISDLNTIKLKIDDVDWIKTYNKIEIT